MDNNNVFCSSYSVWQNESVAFKEHFGYADYTENKKVDDNTIYRLASMTKPITAVAILILVDRGLISLNDSISKYIPGFEDIHIIMSDGIYGFPKGHMENDETESETALREVYEETNIEIELIDGFRKVDEYSVPEKENTIKQVIYFLGEFQNQNVVYQSEELSGAYLLNYTEAISLLKYETLKCILIEADNYIRKNISE